MNFFRGFNLAINDCFGDCGLAGVEVARGVFLVFRKDRRPLRSIFGLAGVLETLIFLLSFLGGGLKSGYEICATEYETYLKNYFQAMV